MRSAAYWESSSNGNGKGANARATPPPKKDWFLHDDRLEDAGDAQAADPREQRVSAPTPAAAPVLEGDADVADWGQHRVDQFAEEVRRPAPAPRQPRQAPAPRQPQVTAAEVRGWQYVDPEGETRGPFTAQKVLTWMEKGYFNGSLQVRRDGSTAWVKLQAVLPQIRAEASRGAAGAQAGRRAPAGAQGAGSPAPRVSAFQRLGMPAAPGGAERREGPRSPAPAARPARDRVPVIVPTTPGRGVGGRRSEEGGRGRGAGRGEQAGRGGRGGRVARPSAPSFHHSVAARLFTAEAELATDQPAWRYIDPTGTVQGPFSAADMSDWYKAGYLKDLDLPVVGHDRRVAPPGLPPPKFYTPLRQLLAAVKAGARFRATTMEDIVEGVKPPFTVQEAGAPAAGPSAGASAAPAVAAQPKGAAAAAEQPKEEAGVTFKEAAAVEAKEAAAEEPGETAGEAPKEVDAVEKASAPAEKGGKEAEEAAPAAPAEGVASPESLPAAAGQETEQLETAGSLVADAAEVAPGGPVSVGGAEAAEPVAAAEAAVPAAAAATGEGEQAAGEVEAPAEGLLDGGSPVAAAEVAAADTEKSEAAGVGAPEAVPEVGDQLNAALAGADVERVAGPTEDELVLDAEQADAVPAELPARTTAGASSASLLAQSMHASTDRFTDAASSEEDGAEVYEDAGEEE